MPQGDKRGAGRQMFDTTYDGHWDGELRRGLGLLADGRAPPAEQPRVSHKTPLDGNGWVGWKNDTRPGSTLDITFEFDTVREFTAVHIYCNNHFTKDVQVSFRIHQPNKTLY